MYSKGKYQFLPFIITVGSILAIDLFGLIPILNGKGLLIGVVIGLISAFGAILHGNLKNSYYFHKENHSDSQDITMKLAEEVSFLNKASIRSTLDQFPAKSSVIIDATNSQYIDYDVLELIKEFKDIKAPLKDIRCELKGFKNIYAITN
jgi:carbonic anhydrase